MKRIPWTEQEDDWLRADYNRANGTLTPYQVAAYELNRIFHRGKNVRKHSAVCRRDGVVNFSK